MITKYFRTIRYANICSSVQDQRLKFNKVRTRIRALEAQRPW